MDVAAFLRQVQTGKVPPLVLVHGADLQAVDETLGAVTRALFPDPTLATLGREVLDARETLADAIVRAAETLPLGVATRLVAVRYCGDLPAKGAEPLREYIKRPAPTTCLLLLADGSLARDRERKVDHWLLEAVPGAAIVQAPLRKGASLAGWLRKRAADEGYTVTDEAAQLLVEWTGDDAVAVLAEVRKAALAGGPDNMAVGKKEVMTIVGEHRVREVFDLTKAVMARNRASALVTLEQLVAGEEPMRILTVLSNELRRAWRVRELTRSGQTPDQIARMLNVPRFVVEGLVASTRGSAGDRLPRHLERCWEVERRLKSRGEPRAELTALVAELCADA